MKILFCRWIKVWFCIFNFSLNILFYIVKLVYINLSNEYQRCQNFVSSAHFNFIQQFIVLILEGLWKEKCNSPAIPLITNLLKIWNCKFTIILILLIYLNSIKANINYAFNWIPPQVQFFNGFFFFFIVFSKNWHLFARISDF